MIYNNVVKKKLLDLQKKFKPLIFFTPWVIVLFLARKRNSALVMAKGKRKRSRSADPGAQKTLKRTRSQSRKHTVQKKVLNTPTRTTRSASRKTLGTRRRQSKRTQASYKWTYVGACVDEQNEEQTAKPGDVVESDVQIFDDKNCSCGTRFFFDRYEDGFIVGHLEGINGRVDIKKTAGHVSVCHATAPNSGNMGRRSRQRTETKKAQQYNAQKVAKGRQMAAAIVAAHQAKKAAVAKKAAIKSRKERERERALKRKERRKAGDNIDTYVTLRSASQHTWQLIEKNCLRQ